MNTIRQKILDLLEKNKFYTFPEILKLTETNRGNTFSELQNMVEDGLLIGENVQITRIQKIYKKS